MLCKTVLIVAAAGAALLAADPASADGCSKTWGIKRSWTQWAQECADSIQRTAAEIREKAQEIRSMPRNAYDQWQTDRRAQAERELYELEQKQRMAIEAKRQRDREVMQLQIDCLKRTCSDETRRFLRTYPINAPAGTYLPSPPDQSGGTRDYGGVDVNVNAKQVDTSANLSDVRSQVLNLAR
ncbi:hypothetical protein [Ancylobacter sp. TS-1]|uniref:hypothetical protein n=1 Tax=Ancylobacter sp. TS-1 TaxID=1850374 RepID=UPI001265C425|nr:hypothetical protein [Ancylobacter sp. TS-1]QFR33580.1 hypothetical protein GBB76_10870 [Ancylobacter sp. TS-1]